TACSPATRGAEPLHLEPVSERFEPAFARESVDAVLEPRGTDLLHPTAATADEVVVVCRSARGVASASRPLLDAVNTGEHAQAHEQIESAEHRRPSDAAAREIAHDVLRGERLRAAQRRRDHLRTRG